MTNFEVVDGQGYPGRRRRVGATPQRGAPTNSGSLRLASPKLLKSPTLLKPCPSPLPIKLIPRLRVRRAFVGIFMERQRGPIPKSKNSKTYQGVEFLDCRPAYDFESLVAGHNPQSTNSKTIIVLEFLDCQPYVKFGGTLNGIMAQSRNPKTPTPISAWSFWIVGPLVILSRGWSGAS